MSVAKFRIRLCLKILIPVLLCLFFYQPLIESGAGFCLRAYFAIFKGWHFNYRSVSLEEGALHFHGWILRDPAHFEAKSERASFFYRKKHLDILSPEVFLKTTSLSSQVQGTSLPFTFQVEEGVLYPEGMESFHFSVSRNFPSQLGHFFFDFPGGGTAEVELIEEANQRVIHIQCNQLDPFFLRKWTAYDVKGSLTGRGHFIEGKEGAFSLEVKNLQKEGLFQDADFFIEWEGPLDCFKDSRLFLDLRGASIFAHGSEIENVSGKLQYLGSMGAKWELKAVGKLENETFPIQSSGKAFLSKERKEWLEGHLLWKEAKSYFAGEKEAKWTWNGTVQGASTEEIAFVQSFAALFEPKIRDVQVESCDLSLKVLGEGKFDDWQLKTGKLEELKLCWKGLTMDVKDFQADYSTFSEEGSFSFQEGTLFREKEPLFSKGKAEGKIDHFTFESKWQLEALDRMWIAETQGTKEDFNVHVATEGDALGELCFQAAFDQSQLFFFLEKASLGTFSFSGCGFVDENLTLSGRVDQFQGPLDEIFPFLHLSLPCKGRIESGDREGLLFSLERGVFNWSLKAYVSEGAFYFPWGECRGVSGEILAQPSSFSCFGMRGSLFSHGVELPFYLPTFESGGAFDFRIQGPCWDFARLKGKIVDQMIELDLKNSQILGEKIYFGQAFLSPEGLSGLQLEWEISLAKVLQFTSHLSGKQKISLYPLAGMLKACLQYEEGGGAEFDVEGELVWQDQINPFRLFAHQEEGKWDLERLSIGALELTAEVMREEAGLFIRGTSAQEGTFSCSFQGRWDGVQKVQFQCPEVFLDLANVERVLAELQIPLFQNIEGTLEGSGHISFIEKLEADFDFTPSHLSSGLFVLNNKGAVQAHYASDEGLFFRGLDFQMHKKEDLTTLLDCKVDLLQFDPAHLTWMFQRAKVHFPTESLSSFDFPLLAKTNGAFDFLLDCKCTSDMSHIQGAFQEGFIPLAQGLCHVQKGTFSYEKEELETSFSYFHRGKPLTITAQVHFADTISGRVGFLEEESGVEEALPLFLEGSYFPGKGAVISSIEGNFAGLEASFHQEGEDALIGSVRFDCERISPWIPLSLAEVFAHLEMGQGYEMKGRLYLRGKDFGFEGLLSGKKVELFGYQLKTLLGQIAISPQKTRIYDLKISDSAGIMKIDEILVEQKGDDPWTIAMPLLVISELRPSLLQKLGKKAPEEASPLVVRELKIVGFQGLLDDRNTYHAKGALHFINSYRRESTFFDLAPDMLSRIAGLDLEILIPACGTLEYELKGGKFHLTELKDSYSEGKRAQFFLDIDEATPTVDLDGNLQIFIKMKQFVLFKLTESFLISIDGKLNDPKFHLQRKRRFLGL